jgi:hypothetical protein
MQDRWERLHGITLKPIAGPPTGSPNSKKDMVLCGVSMRPESNQLGVAIRARGPRSSARPTYVLAHAPPLVADEDGELRELTHYEPREKDDHENARSGLIDEPAQHIEVAHNTDPFLRGRHSFGNRLDPQRIGDFPTWSFDQVSFVVSTSMTAMTVVP